MSIEEGDRLVDEALARGARIPTLEELEVAELIQYLSAEERKLFMEMVDEHGSVTKVISIRLQPEWSTVLDLFLHRKRKAGDAIKRATWCQTAIQRALLEAMEDEHGTTPGD